MLLSYPTRALVLATGIALAVAAPAQAEMMTGEQLRTVVIGQTLEARRFGQTLSMQFNTDGTVTITSPILNGTGTWELQGNTICTSGLRGNATRCMSFERVDDQTLRSSEGMTLRIAS